MACTQTISGIDTSCASQYGGIKAVYICNRSEVASFTVTQDKVSAITLTSGSWLKTFNFRKQTGSLTSTFTIDDTTGTKYCSSSLTLQFSKMETTKRVSIQALIMGETCVIVEDNNGSKWLLGYDNPVTATESTAVTGTNFGDLNGFTLTLSDTSSEYPYELNIADSDWATLIT